MLVRIKQNQAHRVSNQHDVTRPLKCMIHETISPQIPREKQIPREQYYLVESLKEKRPYDAVKGGDRIERYYINPEFPGFWNDDGTAKTMFYEWVSGEIAEVIGIESNDEAIGLLHSDLDYVKLD